MKTTRRAFFRTAAASAVVIPTVARTADAAAWQRDGDSAAASNLAVWEGRPWFTYPLNPGQLGHEAWGRVVAAGQDVMRFRPGDRVDWIWATTDELEVSNFSIPWSEASDHLPLVVDVVP